MNFRKLLTVPLILVVLSFPSLVSAAPAPVTMFLSQNVININRQESVNIFVKVNIPLDALWLAVSPRNAHVIANPYVNMQPIAAGTKIVASWAGLDQFGKAVPNGVYLISVVSWDGVLAQQMVRVSR